jgi:hypothetical protein
MGATARMRPKSLRMRLRSVNDFAMATSHESNICLRGCTG